MLFHQTFTDLGVAARSLLQRTIARLATVLCLYRDMALLVNAPATALDVAAIPIFNSTNTEPCTELAIDRRDCLAWHAASGLRDLSFAECRAWPRAWVSNAALTRLVTIADCGAPMDTAAPLTPRVKLAVYCSAGFRTAALLLLSRSLDRSPAGVGVSGDVPVALREANNAIAWITSDAAVRPFSPF